MSGKKVKVKVKKKKLNQKKIFKLLIVLVIFGLLFCCITNIKVKNIYITGNNIVSDSEIIKLAKLDKYPDYISTFSQKIKKQITKNEYIKSVKVSHKFPGKIYLEIEELTPICIYKEKLVLSSTDMLENEHNIDYVPYVKNNIDQIFDKFVINFSKLNKNILLKISEIEYAPNELDKERFLLYMTDGNYAYITLTKIEKLNKYNSIIEELNNKKGIIHLDSGDYIEIKD